MSGGLAGMTTAGRSHNIPEIGEMADGYTDNTDSHGLFFIKLFRLSFKAYAQFILLTERAEKHGELI